MCHQASSIVLNYCGYGDGSSSDAEIDTMQGYDVDLERRARRCHPFLEDGGFGSCAGYRPENSIRVSAVGKKYLGFDITKVGQGYEMNKDY